MATKLAEVVLLFGALFFSLPYIPSNQMAHIPLFPGIAVATALFAASRALRWWPAWWLAIAETTLFGAFVWGLNGIANILYHA